jgi:nitronate monooxygenase
MVLGGLRHPIVQAPLSGGPSTPDLAVAVSDAGGLGFLASGYRTAEDMRGEIHAVRDRTDAAFGVNAFVPRAEEVDEAALAAYVETLGPDAGEPRFEDDDWDAKLDVLRDERVPLASFTFACPPASVVESLRELGTEVWITVTTPAEARAAAEAGADALVVQGIDAGGHQASWSDDVPDGLGLLALLRVTAAAVDLPLVAAGGIGDAAAVAGALAAGASAAALGTGFMRAEEAGTNAAHRAALAEDRPTAITRAFSGRRARGIVNRFMVEHPDAPTAYPQIHYATTPLRAAARERGDAEGFNLWAGQAHTLAREAPAAEIVRELAAGAG